MKVDRTHSVSASVCSTVPRRISYAVNVNVSERVSGWVNRGRRGWDGMGGEEDGAGQGGGMSRGRTGGGMSRGRTRVGARSRSEKEGM